MNDKKTSAEIRRDTYENFLKATNYCPSMGTIVVVDFLDGSTGIKLGNGKTNVNDLPFLINPDDKKPLVEGTALKFDK